jgi:hypothetical protein
MTQNKTSILIVPSPLLLLIMFSFIGIFYYFEFNANLQGQETNFILTSDCHWNYSYFPMTQKQYDETHEPCTEEKMDEMWELEP